EFLPPPAGPPEKPAQGRSCNSGLLAGAADPGADRTPSVHENLRETRGPCWPRIGGDGPVCDQTARHVIGIEPITAPRFAMPPALVLFATLALIVWALRSDVRWRPLHCW